jgi:nitrate reductase alpha subunit
MRPKYEREIEDILRRFDDGSPPARPTAVPTLETVERPKVVPIRRARRPAISASGMMILALALAVVSAPLQHIYAPAVAYVGIAAAVLLVASLVVSIAKWNSSRPQRTWRGRPVEDEAPFSASALRRRWRRWKAHRRFRDPRWN